MLEALLTRNPEVEDPLGGTAAWSEPSLLLSNNFFRMWFLSCLDLVHASFCNSIIVCLEIQVKSPTRRIINVHSLGGVSPMIGCKGVCHMI